MRGLILTNTYSKLHSQVSQVERFVEEFNKLNVEADVEKMDIIPALIENKTINNLKEKYDFVLYLDKDRYYARMLENLGLKIFNKSEAIEICDDKMLTHIELAKYDIPMPKTIAGVLNYTSINEVSKNVLKQVENEFDFPIVVKESYGSLGKGVFLANNHKELVELANKLMNRPHLFQEFIKSSFGTDIRVVVIGGQAIAWMQRKSNGDFRSNIGSGGEGINIDLPDSFRKCAEKTATNLGLDYCGIDLLFGENNEPLVCEVNSNAFFEELEKVTKKNVAEAYCKHIINQIK